MTHAAEAVCPCGETWTLEVQHTPAVRMDARTACMFAVERSVAVRQYNAHAKLCKKKGRGDPVHRIADPV